MKRKQGFTIVELLTVMGVIAVLIGLLVPALALVKEHAKRLQQRAQFHAIEVGLEIFKNEFGSYPESSDNAITGKETGTSYCGANKLAEAMVGLDMIGFHPNADFRSDGLNDVIGKDGATIPGVRVYATGDTGNWQSLKENIDARKGPFLDLENANAFRMDEVYSTFTGFKGDSLVLCDVYAAKRGGLGSKKTGTPILYYRARSNYSQQDYTSTANADGTSDDIYNYLDNDALLALGMPNADATLFSVMNSGNIPLEFENMVINDNVQTIRRPYRADAFILISAGKDGDFGTADDVFNFQKEVIE